MIINSRVMLFLWLAGQKLRDIGLLSGASVTLLALVVGYTVELLVLSGSNASLHWLPLTRKPASPVDSCSPSGWFSETSSTRSWRKAYFVG